MAREVGYPLVVRPSYVLGGRAMEVVYAEEDLKTYMTDRRVSVSNDSPVLLDRFLDQAIEVDVDAVCDGTDVLIGGIMEHVEQAGVHSGDSSCSLPPNSLSFEIQQQLREQTRKLALGLKVVGLMNVQFAIQNGVVYVLEVNPRASRTAPFVSKATGRADRQARRAGDDGPQACGARRHRRDRAGVLLGEGSRVPVRQVPRVRSHPRPGDEIHRRSHGHGPHLRRGLCRRRRPAPAPRCRARARR